MLHQRGFLRPAGSLEPGTRVVLPVERRPGTGVYPTSMELYASLPQLSSHFLFATLFWALYRAYTKLSSGRNSQSSGSPGIW